MPSISSPESRLAGVGFTLISALTFSCLPIFNRYASAAGGTFITVLGLRFTLAALLMWLVLLWRAGRRGPGGASLRLSRRAAAGMAFMGGLYVLQSSCFFLSSVLIPVAMTSVLLYLYPAIVALLAWLFLRERLTGFRLMALALALAGAMLVVGQFAAAGNGLGVALGLASAVLYSIYIVIGSRLQRGIPPQIASAYIMTSAGAIFLAGGAVGGALQFNLGPGGYASIGALAVVCTVVPMVTLFAGMQRIGPAQASIVSTVEPVGTALLGALLLGEALAPVQWLGGALVIAAVLVLSLQKPA